MIRILYVEDNQINRFVFEKLLARHAHITMVDNGPDGVALAEKECFDLVVLDLNLDQPNYDGFDVIRELYAIGFKKRCNAIIFALTAYSGIIWEEKTMEAGFDGYFSKPIDPNTLLSTYHELKGIPN